MAQACPECGEGFTGRSDKIYCSDHCRTAHYNRKNRAKTRYIRNVNNILLRNRSILCELNPAGKAIVKKHHLTDQGFNFKFITNTYTTNSGSTYFFCYEQGYLPLENGTFALVVKKEYVDSA